jgi:hypothetical protein
LACVGLDCAKVGRSHCHQFNIFAEQSAQHAIEFDYQIIEIQSYRHYHLTPGEGQKLFCQIAGAVSRSPDFPDVLSCLIGLRLIHKSQLSISSNGGQEIVEIVGDTACQLHDGLHFLGLRQLQFQKLALFDVHNCGLMRHRFPIII